MKKWGFGKDIVGFALFFALTACAKSATFAPYNYGTLNTDSFVQIDKEGYYREGVYAQLKCADKGAFDASLSSIYSFGFRRNVLSSVGERYLTVIPVDFSDAPADALAGGEEKAIAQIQEAFFGSSSGNQFVSLAEYYEKTSFHRLHVKGEVTAKPFRSEETYAALKAKNNASQTKAALSRIYSDAITWYNSIPGQSRVLTHGDPIYFVYLAPYAGMDGDTTSRSSMMWAFTINDPAPICWSSYYMMHPRDEDGVDAHTFIHEFGHILGLKDYYDQNSYSELSSCSPMGRMDMMDCSLGEHNAFSKMVLDWTRPYIPTGEATITLRPASGNGDCVLLPLSEYNGTPYDEYLLLEYYTPTYLNYADARLRDDAGMSLMAGSGIKVYHVDARLGVFDDRAKKPIAAFTPSTTLGGYSLDFYRDNSGLIYDGVASSEAGFLIKSIPVSSSALPSYYIAGDHDQDINYNGVTAHMRDCLFEVGQGIDASFPGLSFHSGRPLSYSFKVTSITATMARIAVCPILKN